MPELKYVPISLDAVLRFYVENAMAKNIRVTEHFYDPAAKTFILGYLIDPQEEEAQDD